MPVIRHRPYRSHSPTNRQRQEEMDEDDLTIGNKRRELDQCLVENRKLQLACEQLKHDILTVQIHTLRKEIAVLQNKSHSDYF